MPYLDRVIRECPQDGHAYFVMVAHDDWCPILADEADDPEACTCEAVIRFYPVMAIETDPN